MKCVKEIYDGDYILDTFQRHNATQGCTHQNTFITKKREKKYTSKKIKQVKETKRNSLSIHIIQSITLLSYATHMPKAKKVHV